MWGESSKKCESNCQCSGLITENFKINSGNSATKRKLETALAYNYKHKMNPTSLNFASPTQSPIAASKKRILGEIQNFQQNSPIIDRLKSSPNLSSPINKSFNSLKSPQTFLSLQNNFNKSPLTNLKSPLNNLKSSLNNLKSPLNNLKSPLNILKSPLTLSSPLNHHNTSVISTHSPLTSRLKRKSKITRIFEERTKFKMANKENLPIENETFMKLDVEEETRDCNFGMFKREKVENWGMPKLDFTDALSQPFETHKDILVPEKETDMDDLESLQDLEAEFENENFDQCTKYEIISTDSPNIISRGRSSTSRKVNSRNFDFGAPIADCEQSTSFNRPATRMLNFDDDNFEFTSPAVKKTVSVKKSLKFNETPTKLPLRHERSDSSIGSLSMSPSSSRLRLFTSESTTSMESGFISEFEEPFLEIEDSNSPKISNFNSLLSGQIKENIITNKNFLKRPTLGRSLSFHPESKAKISLLSILENPKTDSVRTVASASRTENSASRTENSASSTENSGFRIEEENRKKRTDRYEEEHSSKRRKSNCESPLARVQRPVLQRAFSENNASIMSALARSAVDPDLIGDFTQPFALPMISGDHSDLKSISCDTLAALMRGEYHDTIDDFQVIDCRYPYEFEGGHINSAINLYTTPQIQNLVQSPLEKKKVLIFHCEFSLERGPNLTRYLRSSDRAKNKENYPNLDYPEIYLLHEGYRKFYQKYPELCNPEGYTAMLDPKHRHLLKKHRSVSQPSSSMRRNRLLL